MILKVELLLVLTTPVNWYAFTPVCYRSQSCPELNLIKNKVPHSTTKSLSLNLLISLCVEFKEKEGWALPSHSLLIHCLSIYIRVEFE